MTYTKDKIQIAYQAATKGGLGGVAGRAMTEYKCTRCGIQELWQDTNTPLVCAHCSMKFAAKLENVVDVESIKDMNEDERRNLFQYISLHTENAIGFDVISKFSCKRCERECLWGHSATPDFCESCSIDISEAFVQSLRWLDRYEER